MKKDEIELIGTTIKNGAMVIAYDIENSRVLCLFNGEFVVWGYYNPTTKIVEYGHYFMDNLEEAIHALNFNRTNKYWSKEYIREGK